MARRAALVKKLAAENPGVPIVHVDAGGFAAPGSIAGEIKTRAIISACRAMGVDAVNVTARDLRASLKRMAPNEGEAVMFVSADIVEAESNKHVFNTVRIVDAKGIRVGITGLSGGLGSGVLGSTGGQVAVLDANDSVAAIMRVVRSKADFLILLTDIPFTDIQERPRLLEGFDLVLGADGYTATEQARMLNGALVSYAGAQGKYLGVLKFAGGRGGELELLEHRLVKIAPTLPEDLEVAGIVKAAAAEIGRLESVEKAMAENAASAYIGFIGCRPCHRSEYEAWKSSRHHRAFDALITARQSENPACLKCHTTGRGNGGYVDTVMTPRLIGVQCESCHGPGRSHADFPESRKALIRTSTEECRACHTSSRSPGFDGSVYLRRIRHKSTAGARSTRTESQADFSQ